MFAQMLLCMIEELSALLCSSFLICWLAVLVGSCWLLTLLTKLAAAGQTESRPICSSCNCPTVQLAAIHWGQNALLCAKRRILWARLLPVRFLLASVSLDFSIKLLQQALSVFRATKWRCRCFVCPTCGSGSVCLRIAHWHWRYLQLCPSAAASVALLSWSWLQATLGETVGIWSGSVFKHLLFEYT